MLMYIVSNVESEVSIFMYSSKEQLIYSNTNCRSGYLNIHRSCISGRKDDSHFITPSSDCHVFGYIIEGTGTIEAAENVIPLEKGDFYYICKGMSATLSSDPNKNLSGMWLEADGALTQDLLHIFQINGIAVFHRDVSHFFTEIHSRLMARIEENTPDTLQRIACLLFEMLTELRKDTFFPQPNHKQSTAEAIRDYLNTNLYNDISLDNITEKFGISKMHVIRLFKKKYNTTPMQYLGERRVTIAKSLLSDTVMPIKEISGLLQYSNTQHFSNSFKNAVGVSPNQYRKLKQKA